MVVMQPASRRPAYDVLEERDTVEGKGILHPQEQARHRDLDRLPAGPAVERYVEWYWAVRWDLRDRPSYTAEVLPHPSVNVTFEQTSTRTGAFVTGVCTRKYERELAGLGWTFGVKFWPGGFGAYTGADVGALRDDSVPLGEIFPDAGRLTDLVLSAADDVRRKAVLDAYLSARQVEDDPSYELVLRIVTAMVNDRGLTRVDQVTQRFGVPVRTLQRLRRGVRRGRSRGTRPVVRPFLGELCRRGRGGVAQERRAALGLVGLADRAGCLAERGQAAQEPAVRLVLPRHRAVALPAVTAQRVEAAVVAGPGVGVALDRAAVRERGLGQGGPGQRGRRERRGDLGRVLAGGQLGGRGVLGKQGLGRSGQQVVEAHAAILADRFQRFPATVRRPPGR